MKTLTSLASLVFLAAAQMARAAEPAAPAPAEPATATVKTPQTLEERASYLIGMNLGESLRQQQVPVDLALLELGLRTGLAGGDSLLSDEVSQATMSEFQQQMMAAGEARRGAAAAKNQADADAFLATNKARAGVVTTASGLQLEVLQEGTGAQPKASDTVTVHYRGTLLDGTVFDNSWERNEPASFRLDQVIPGWTEGLQLVKVGSKVKLFLPPSLAYGASGAGADIGPNAALIFEVELLAIEAAEEAAAPEAADEAAAAPPSES